jgi:hypothetical protein
VSALLVARLFSPKPKLIIIAIWFALFFSGETSVAEANIHKLTFAELKDRPWTDREAMIELARRGDPEIISACLDKLGLPDEDLAASGELVLAEGAPPLLLHYLAGAFDLQTGLPPGARLERSPPRFCGLSDGLRRFSRGSESGRIGA